MKTCTLCKAAKELDSFNRKSASKDGYQNICKDCSRLRSKQYYANNREEHIQVIMDNRNGYAERNREYLANYLKDHPCVDCGYSDIRALEFDHLDDKKAGVAQLARSGYALATLIIEMEKCEVRCRNCHQIKTYERMGGSWHDNYFAAQALK